MCRFAPAGAERLPGIKSREMSLKIKCFRDSEEKFSRDQLMRRFPHQSQRQADQTNLHFALGCALAQWGLPFGRSRVGNAGLQGL
jgi:hypothetical protein